MEINLPRLNNSLHVGGEREEQNKDDWCILFPFPKIQVTEERIRDKNEFKWGSVKIEHLSLGLG